jgi:cytochrome c5
MRCWRPGYRLEHWNNKDLSLWSRILTQDKKSSPLFDTGTLLIIFFGIVAVALYIFVKNLSEFTASLNDSDAEYHASVEERIRPFGRVRLPGEELAPGEIQVDEVPQAEPVATIMSGPQVFNEACIVCHGSGIGGAPTLADSAAWAPRIAQGMDTLYQRALEGYTGSMGYMPPKGARLDLSDEEVSGAVDYMLGQVSN